MSRIDGAAASDRRSLDEEDGQAGDEEAQRRELRGREAVERQLGGDEGEPPDHRGERRQNHVANRHRATPRAMARNDVPPLSASLGQSVVDRNRRER